MLGPLAARVARHYLQGVDFFVELLAHAVEESYGPSDEEEPRGESLAGT